MTAAGLVAAALGLLAMLAGRMHPCCICSNSSTTRPPIATVGRAAACTDGFGDARARCRRGGRAHARRRARCGCPRAHCRDRRRRRARGYGTPRSSCRPQTKPLVFTARARRLFVVALLLPALVLLLAAAAVLAGAPAWTAPAIGDGRRRARSDRRSRACCSPPTRSSGPFRSSTTAACQSARSRSSPSRPARGRHHRLVREDHDQGLRRGRGGVARPRVRHARLLQHLPRRGPRHQRGAHRQAPHADRRDGRVPARRFEELCDLVHPTIGVLTAIGPAHLERFGSLDAHRAGQGRARRGCAGRRHLHHHGRRRALPAHPRSAPRRG